MPDLTSPHRRRRSSPERRARGDPPSVVVYRDGKIASIHPSELDVSRSALQFR